MAIKRSDLNSSDGSDSTPANNRKTKAKFSVEADGGAELKLFEEESKARRANEAKRLELEERPLA